MTEANETPLVFIPQAEGERLEAGEEFDGRHHLKKRMRTMAAFEVVVWDAGTQMMDVMEADVAREPLENFRKLVEGTALQCRCRVIPVFTAFPINAFELMLHIKEPYAQAAGHHQDDRLDDHVRHHSE